MTNPKINTGKGMRPHKCPHGRQCDAGNKFLCGNNTPGCRMCSLKRRIEDYEERGLLDDAKSLRKLLDGKTP